MDVFLPWQRTGGKGFGPRQVANRAEAAAIEPAADPSERDADGQGRGDGVGHGQEGKRVAKPVDHRADEAPR